MANYRQRGTDVSQFLGELNRINPTDPQDDHTFEDPNLDLYASQEFFDFETGTQNDFSAPLIKPTSDSPGSSKATTEPAPTPAAMMNFGDGLDFMNADFNFGDFNSSYAPSPILSTFTDGPGSLQPIQPSPQAAYPPVPHAHQHAYAHHAVGQPKAGEKRRATEPQVPNRPMSIEEASRVAAEEDKRRRNTAASARFRVKKKQREQALEKSAKEASDQISQLQAKVTQLETENKWLKELILQKDNSSSEGSKDGVKGAGSNKSSIEVKLDEADKVAEPEAKRPKKETA